MPTYIPPSWASLHPLNPTHLGHHRTPSWAPYAHNVIKQLYPDFKKEKGWTKKVDNNKKKKIPSLHLGHPLPLGYLVQIH